MNIRIRSSFYVYALAILALAGWYACAGLLIALIVHEASHAFAAKLLKEAVGSIELAPFGGVMHYKPGHTASKGIRGIMVAFAGPLGNYLTILCIGAVCNEQAFMFWQAIIKANLSMMLLNMLPALPFDGGSILLSIGYYLFDVSRLIGFLSFMGVFCGALLCILAIIGLLKYGLFNLSMFTVGVYVLFYANACRNELLTQNIYAIISERINGRYPPRSMTLFKVKGDERLMDLIPCLYRSRSAAFFLETENGNPVLIGEQQLCQRLFINPLESIEALIKKQEKGQ